MFSQMRNSVKKCKFENDNKFYKRKIGSSDSIVENVKKFKSKIMEIKEKVKSQIR